MNKTAEQFRVALFEPATAAEDGRIPVVISSDAVVEMTDGSEILVHSADAVDLTRAPLPLIVTHRGNQINVGLVEDIAIVDGKARGFARFGERDEAVQYAKDVVNGIIRAVSVGYRRIKAHMRSDGVMVTTRWMPFHTALVAEPADVNAGFYRAMPEFELEEFQALPDPAHTAAGISTSSGERTMSTAIETPAEVQPTAPTASRGHDPLIAERDRMREIQALGRQFNLVGDADAAIESGASTEAFRKLVTDKLVDHGKIRPAESPEIGMSARDVEQFSFCRALLAASDPYHAATLAPFELECSRAAQDKRGDSRDKTREAAITIPADVLSRGLNAMSNEGMAASVASRLVQRAQRGSASMQTMVRDLVVGTAGAGGNVVATELLGSSFIEMLRNVMVLDKLGITWLRDLNGNLAIPSQTGGASTYWVAENGAVTESQQTFGQVTMTPKTIGAFTDYARRLLIQASIDVEMFVRLDLALQIAQGLQNAAFNGSGASNQPTGLLNTSGIGSVAGGTNGLAPTYDHMVDLESAVAIANADVGTLGYCTNAKVRGKLRKTQEFSSTNGKAVWTRGSERGVGDVLGYDAYVTNGVPANLDKGTSVGVCSAIMYGNWADLLIGMWGGLDVMLDPYTGSASGTKRVVALQDVDIAVRRVASFAAMKDALTV